MQVMMLNPKKKKIQDEYYFTICVGRLLTYNIIASFHKIVT